MYFRVFSERLIAQTHDTFSTYIWFRLCLWCPISQSKAMISRSLSPFVGPYLFSKLTGPTTDMPYVHRAVLRRRPRRTSGIPHYPPEFLMSLVEICQAPRKGSLVVKFPAEILATIFSFIDASQDHETPNISLNDDTGNIEFDESKWEQYLQSRQPFNVVAVCRFWRSTALSLSWLWASWDIVIKYPISTVVESVDRFVSRSLKWSKTSPLDFKFSFDPQEYRASEELEDELEGLLSPLCSILVRLSSGQHRWRNVHIFLHPFASCHASTKFRHWNELLLDARASSPLEELRTDCKFMVLRPTDSSEFPLKHLRHMEVKGVDALRFSMDDVNFISSGERLISLDLELHSIMIWHPPNLNDIHIFNSKEVIKRPGLLHLGVSIEPMGNGVLRMFFSRLHSPSLTSLDLYGTLASVEALLDFLRRNMPPLVSLKLDVSRGWTFEVGISAPFIECLQLIPLVTSLTFRCCVGNPFAPVVEALSKRNSQAFHLVPRLEELKISHATIPCDAASTVIQSRWRSTPRTLRRVCLHRCVNEWNNYLPMFPCVWERNWEEVAACVVEGFVFESSL